MCGKTRVHDELNARYGTQKVTSFSTPEERRSALRKEKDRQDGGRRNVQKRKKDPKKGLKGMWD